MKGIILAGGAGTRLYPLTKSISKQILPIYDKPMIYYPLSVLMLTGIKEVLIISTPRDLPLFKDLFNSGEWLGMNFSYEIQDTPRGLADAFIIGEKFLNGDTCALILGDNIFYGRLFSDTLVSSASKVSSNGGAAIFSYYVKEPSVYGVIEFDNKGNAVSIEEKPANPKSHYAIPGLYFYDAQVSEIAKKIKPSRRGEIEITSINNYYLEKGKLSVEVLGRGMAWLDTGTYDGLLEASNFISTIQKRQGLYVSCIEEIAYNNKWISRDSLLQIADSYKTDYGDYLRFIAKE
jgi:glucose-1-phosphate thymidylyltransferase